MLPAYAPPAPAKINSPHPTPTVIRSGVATIQVFMTQAPPPAATKNARKVARLLEVTPDESLRQALDYIYDSVGPTEWKTCNLKLDIDRRLLGIHARFLKEFAVVDAQLRDVSTDIDRLSGECTSAKHELQSVTHASKDLLRTAETLQAEIDELKAREEHVLTFMSQFQLSREESETLAKDVVSPRFVQILNKIYDIREKCLHIPEEQAAIEIRESLYLTQMTAVDKLTRHLINISGDVFSGDQVCLSDFFVDAMTALIPHPGSWIKVAQEIARVRRTSVIRRFLNLLTAMSPTAPVPASRTRGGAPVFTGMDAVRLCGDLCAWLHTTIAEDSDTLGPIFADAAVSAGMSRTDALDLIYEGVCRHFRERMNQALSECGCGPTIVERPDPAALLLLFRLEGLLGFYCTTTEALLGTNASLTECMRSMRLETMKVFFEALQSAMRRTVSASSCIAPDLGLSPEANAMVRLIKSMMDHLQTSFVPQQQREADFAPVLSAVIDPLISLAETAELPSTVSNENRVNSREVHKINVACILLGVLIPFDFASSKQTRLSALLEEIIVRFIDLNAMALRVRFGLEQHLQNMQSDQGVDRGALAETAATLYRYIYNVGSLSIPQLEYVQVLRIRDRLRVEITRSVCNAYSQLYDAISEQWGPETAQAVLNHDPEQLRVLLDVV